MKNVSFIAILAFILLTLSASAQRDGWKDLEDTDFYIEYPGDQYVEQDPLVTSMLFLIITELESGDDNFRENINLVKDVLPHSDVPLEAYAQSGKELISQYFTDFEVVKFAPEQYQGQNYYVIIYRATQGIYSLKFCQRSYILNGVAYVLTFTAEVDKFDKYLASVSEIMNSFKLK